MNITSLIGDAYFLDKLYDEVPEFKNVEIIEIKRFSNGHDVLIKFVLPQKVDYIPPKWLSAKYEYPEIELRCIEVSKFMIDAGKGVTRVTLKMSNDNNYLLASEELKLLIKAEYIYIQKINGTKWVFD